MNKQKSKFIVMGKSKPLRYFVVPKVDFKFFDRLDELFKKYEEHSISKDSGKKYIVDNVFDIVDYDRNDNLMKEKFSEIVREKTSSGGAFYTQFLYQYFGGKTICVRDLQEEKSSLVKRSFPNGTNITICHDRLYQFNDKCVRASVCEKYDYVISYFNLKPLYEGGLDNDLYKEVKKGATAFIFYFDPYEASRARNKSSYFKFLYTDGLINKFELNGVEFSDYNIKKDYLVNKYDQYFFEFLTIPQLDKLLGTRICPMVNATNQQINKYMMKNVRVIRIRYMEYTMIPEYDNIVDVEFKLSSIDTFPKCCIRPFMMNEDRKCVILSNLTWYSQKIDGYQGVVRIGKTRDREGNNCKIILRSGQVYESFIKYSGEDVEFQATVTASAPPGSDKWKVDRFYYEDLIRCSKKITHTFRGRALYMNQFVKAGLPMTMKKWSIYNNQMVGVEGKDSEGIIFQIDAVIREKNGVYKSLIPDRTCYFLVDVYSIDVSVVDGWFYMDDRKYKIDEGNSSVREIVVTSFEPFKYEFVRDRPDRRPMFHKTTNCEYNSVNKDFLDDYKSALSIDGFNRRTSVSIEINHDAALFYLFYKEGGVLTNVSEQMYEGVKYIISTGKARLTHKNIPVDHGFYYWRDYFQNTSSDDWKFSDIDLDDIFI